jgi:hypothetical protein
MTNFCTLFNSNYVSRGLVLYQSLVKACPQFHLYIFAFDEDSLQYLRLQQLPHVTVISLTEFEDDELLAIKTTRSAVEYCWTCTPSSILYCLTKYHLSNCTYIDADMFFYSNPDVLIKEAGDASVIIVKHNYTPLYDQAVTTGIFCVEFMYFKNTAEGLAVLTWWRQACNNWCYARLEDGKFGDQKYLDEWPQKFKGVHVLLNPGGGVAPWNIQQFNVTANGENLFIGYKKNTAQYPVVFFHFHGLKFFKGNQVLYTDALYEITDTTAALFYKPYIQQLIAAAEAVKQKAVFDANGSQAAPAGKLTYYRKYLMNLVKYALKNNPWALFDLKNYNFKHHYHLHTYNQKGIAD